MSESLVVVFPSTFAQKKLPLLAANIKKILKARGQRFRSVRRDGPLIIVDAEDPVLASSAINLLFGIRRVAIARQAKNDYDTMIGEITRLASKLLLRGDLFYVMVEGHARGFMPKDLEMAATSSIIEKLASTGARPGTRTNHSKLLYTFLTRTSSYICIFMDDGLGGIPFNAHDTIVACGIFDELSAVSCLETIKQGFAVKILVIYTEKTLLDLAKMLNRIIPRILDGVVELEFFRMDGKKPGPRNYLRYFEITNGIVAGAAGRLGLDHVSLPLSPLVFPARIIDETLARFGGMGITVYAPLGALEEEIYRNAREIGLGKFLGNIEALAGMGAPAPDRDTKETVKKALDSSRTLRITAGPNNVHEILDGLGREDA